MVTAFLTGWSQTKTASNKKKTKTTPKTDSSVSSKQVIDTSKGSRYDTQLIAVVTLKKDTLFFNKDETICYTIKEVWDMKDYPDRPVILFVSSETLYSVRNRLYGPYKVPTKN